MRTCTSHALFDWGSASSAPIAEALLTPGLRVSTSETRKLLASAFRARFERASCGGELITGPSLWSRADVMQLLLHLVRMLSTRDYYDFVALYAPVNQLGEEDDWYQHIPALFDDRSKRRENRVLLARLREDDMPRDCVEQHERAAFGSPEPASTAKLAVARKLTLMAEMNKEFIADRRLWRWVEDAMDGQYN